MYRLSMSIKDHFKDWQGVIDDATKLEELDPDELLTFLRRTNAEIELKLYSE